MKRSKLKTSALLLGASTAFAGSDTANPPVGSYGFDWFNPASAQCKRMTEKDIGNFGGCKYKKEGGSFGLDLPYYSCRVNRKVEYLVYLTKSDCTEAKETMDANAP